MNQAGLFPIQLVDEIDSPYTHGKDAKALGIDEVDNEYLLKRLQDGRLLPLTEWMSYHICRLCGIPTPEFAVVIRPNREPAFGSKIDSAVVDFNRAATLSNAQQVSIVMDAGLSESAALAFDAFLPNPDRHFGNWLYAARRGKFVALSIDWSRAHFLDRPLFSGWPWPPGSKSAESLSYLKTFGVFSAAEAHRVFDALAGLDADDIEAVLGSAPELWRENVVEDAILDWWKSSRHQRIEDSKALILT